MFDFCLIERKLRNGETYSQGWLLEIDSVESLHAWAKLRNEVVDIWSDLKSRDGQRDHFKNEKSYMFKLKIEKMEQDSIGLVDFCNMYDNYLLAPKIDMLSKYGKIYINKVGGFCTLGDEGEIKERVSLKNLIFPKTKEKEYSITQFPNGEHYYINLNGQSIVIEGIEKWDSYEEAKNAIKNISTKTKSKEELFNE